MATPRDESRAESRHGAQHRLWQHLQHPLHARVVSRLAGMLSHEMRNPLTTLCLHTDILAEALPQVDAQRAAQLAPSVQFLRTETQRLETLVQSFLWLLRLPDIPRSPTDLGAYVETLLQERQPWLTAHQIVLERQDLTTLGSMALHEPTFQRLLLHVLHNAVDAMPQGGHLRIAGQRCQRHLCLTVQDTGSGIPAAQLPFLYQPFHTTKADAMGLGLYMARAISLAHDGEMTIQSTSGVGTTVQLVFPVCTDGTAP